MSFVEDSLQRSSKVAPFIKVPVIQISYCYCLENLKAPVVSIYAMRVKENLSELNKHLETIASCKKEVFISFQDALEYS